MYFTGVIIAILAFLTIGLFHPIVIKTEYYTGVRYWWAFVVAGIAHYSGIVHQRNHHILRPRNYRSIVPMVSTGTV